MDTPAATASSLTPRPAPLTPPSATLRRKMAYQIAIMIVGLLLIICASLWGVLGLHQDFGSALAGHQELRQIYEASSHVTTARTLVSLSPHAEAPATNELKEALARFEQYSPAPDHAPSATRKAEIRRSIRANIEEALKELRALAITRNYDPKALTAPPDRALADVSQLVAEIRKDIETAQADADRKSRTTLLVISALSAAVVLASVLVGLSQYRMVMHPLRRLGAGVRRVAGGNLSDRVEPVGPAEFVALADDFNRMAAELDGLYRELERKVADKSRELVRSERLASVGYLAAGVAHEINNPIGIIAGYAEFTLGKLKSDPPSAASEEAAKALAVIAEEAFRCKQIVARLLTLARPGEEKRTTISLPTVAESVIAAVRGLRESQGRQIALSADENSGPLDVLASEGEMKQVILNLTLNALDAVAERDDGEVRLDVRRDGPWVELSVIDNGRGMSGDILERIFEPFFTAKRGSSHPGTGLGLSITHAIVRDHGGTIAAHSDGPGEGSRFVVRLPHAE